MIDYFQVRTKSFSSLISGHKSANLTVPKQYLLKSKALERLLGWI